MLWRIAGAGTLQWQLIASRFARNTGVKLVYRHPSFYCTAGGSEPVRLIFERHKIRRSRAASI